MTFTVVGALILAAVVMTVVLAGGRAFAPVPVYCGTWAALLGFYALSAQVLAPLQRLDENTVLFYVIAALVFAAGCGAASLRPAAAAVRDDRAVIRPAAFSAAIALCLIALPVIYLHVRELLNDVPLDQLLYFARVVDVASAQPGAPSLLGPFANAIPFSIAVVLLIYAVPVPKALSRTRPLLLAATLGMLLLTGGRSAIVSLLVGLTGLLAMSGRLRLGRLLMLTSLFFLLFFAIGLLVKKGGASLDVSASENVRLLIQGFRDYTVGGSIAFQRVLQHPGEVPSTGGVTRTAELILNGFGAHYSVPSLHAAYTDVGDRVVTNVYTAYFSYIEDGFAGTIALVFVSGFAITMIYRRALAGNAIAMAVYGSLLAGMVLSVFGEGFYTNINFLAKLLICGLLLLRRAPRRRPALPQTTLQYSV